MRPNRITKTLATLAACSYLVASASLVQSADAETPKTRAKSGHRTALVQAIAYQDPNSPHSLFGNPFSDDVPGSGQPALAPQPADVIQYPGPSVPPTSNEVVTPSTVVPNAAPIPAASPVPMNSPLSSPMSSPMSVPGVGTPAGTPMGSGVVAPTAVPPLQTTPVSPSYGAAVPSYGAAVPSCGAAAPSCGAAAPSCGAAAPSCGAPAKSCENGCGVGCGCQPPALDPCSTDTCCKKGCAFGLCNCELGDAFTISGLLHGDCPTVTVGGWLSAGYHSKGNDLFNSRPEEIALHQGWLYAEKVATANSPIGFRADLMYGIDANDTQAFGNPSGSWDFENSFDHGSYGWAIPQAYVEVALGDSLSVKAGHFYTLVGYEVVTAPDNFFYSHAMTMYNSEPFTHTGVLATATLSDNLTAYGGWTLGWDTGFNQLNSGSSFLGGASLAFSDDASLTYIATAGNFGWRGDEAYSHSILLDMTLTDRLNWVVQSDLVRVASTGEDNVGVNQYLLYSISDCLGLGTRVEWWKGDVLTGYAPHGGVLPAAGSLSYYAATFGANIRPHANFVIRPEVRLDWSPAADYDETYYGIDAIFTF